jgi:hypothetical protein
VLTWPRTLRAVLTPAELVTFLDTVLREQGGAVLAGSAPVGATTAGKQPGGISGQPAVLAAARKGAGWDYADSPTGCTSTG